MTDLVRDLLASGLVGIVPLATTPAATGFGRDLVCIDDLDPRGSETDPSSLNSLAQDLYHRLATARGQMPDDPDYGLDLVELLHRPGTQTELLAMAGAVTAEMRKDDRVTDAETTLTLVGNSMTVAVAITPKDPTIAIFTLIVSVTDGATLLQEIIQ